MLRILFLTLAAALIGEPVADQTPYDSDPGKSLIPLILGTSAPQQELGLDAKQREEIQNVYWDFHLAEESRRLYPTRRWEVVVK